MPSDNPPLLKITQLSAGYNQKTILNKIDLDIPQRGIFGIMGPSGTGKSTLLRTLGHCNDLLPSFWVKGSICLKGKDLLASDTQSKEIAFLRQKARLYTGTVWENLTEGLPTKSLEDQAHKEQFAKTLLEPLNLWETFCDDLDRPVMSLPMLAHKQILLTHLLASNPCCLLVDEPLRDIAVVEEEVLISLLRHISSQRVVVMVTHNKQEAQQLCDDICLISGDSIIEVTPSNIFFTQPKTKLGQAFLNSGSSWHVPSPQVDESPLTLETPPSPPAKKNHRLPREFHWIIANLLGGMQYPGLLGDDDEDLAALQALDVKVLVSLTEIAYDFEKLTKNDIQGKHFPIVDMSIPTLEEAEQFCEEIEQCLQKNLTTVLHCKAGLGRTGTLLACMLVYRKSSAIQAIDKVRLTNPYYIQNEIQFNFIAEFEDYLNQV
ncbi:MAG: ATP-binding cassette domain-containing protein [Methylococcaceae bacterium]|nr:ATP-binding cassette domain-containing protein [Methylococcaceae bacterium]